MSELNDDQMKEYLEHMFDKINKVVNKGDTILEQIPQLVKNKLSIKFSEEDISSLVVDDKILNRRYGTIPACELAGISHTLLYASEERGDLPPPQFKKDKNGKDIRAGYTINDINHMREVFNTAPRKPKGSRAAIVGVLNLKGGCHKTTTCIMFSQYLAIQGYRVLVLDTDPQGSLSFFYGKYPDKTVHYEHTIGPYMLEEDEVLEEAGFGKEASKDLRYAIQKTYWNNIDIIPCCLATQTIDLDIPVLMSQGEKSSHYYLNLLRNGLHDIADDYDFIIIDGTPSLNLSTINVLAACDMCFVPTPASMADFASTLQFTKLLTQYIEDYVASGVYINVPDLRYFITKYSKSSYAQFMANVIRKVMHVESGDVLKNESYVSDEIGKATNSTYSIYEKNPSDSDNRQKLKKTVEMFDMLFEEMLEEVKGTCFDNLETENELDGLLQNVKLENEKSAMEGA